MRLAARPLVAATIVWLLLPAAGRADCDPAGPLARTLPKADVAFVGSVTVTDGSVAQFAVAEVWAGDVPGVVEVRGLTDRLPGQRGPIVEDDRLWIVGETYLVVPILDRGVLRDSICTATTEWNADLEPLRPADARILTTPDEAAISVPPALILAGAVVVLIAGASVLAFRRR